MAFKFVRIATIALVIFSAASCGNFLKPHRISIQQGNIVTANLLEKLEIGMTRRQVKYVLGTPLITDSLSPDYWLYLYTYLEGNTGKQHSRHIKLRFEDDVLAHIDTDVEPTKEAENTEKNPVQQIVDTASDKLDKRVETEREDSVRDAGI